MEKYVVGQIINRKTGFPHLDVVGDVGWVKTEQGKTIAKYVTVRVYPDPETNEVLTEDVQIVKSLDRELVEENPEARCHVHGRSFPCSFCEKLEKENYGRPVWA